MSKTVKWILIASGVLLIALIILGKMGAFGKDEGVKVTSEKAKKASITEVVSATGKIYPEVEVKITPEVSGKVVELKVKEGDSVKRGQLLARIDPDAANIQRSQAASGVAQSQAQAVASQAQVSNSQAALEALKAQMDQAERTYNMQKQLYDEKVISLSEFNVAEANLRSAKANYNAAVQGIRSGQANARSAQASVQSAQSALARANKDVNRTVLVATMDGVISLLNVKQGEGVAGNTFNVGTEIMRIADMNKIEIRVDVGENDIPKVKLGDTALITVDAYSKRKFKGLVTQIASSNNGAAAQSALGGTNTDVTQYKVHVRILLDSYKDLIGSGSFPFKPGMTASADIQTKTHKDVIAVPINAVTTREKSDTASVGKAVKKAEPKKESNNNSEDDLDVVVFVLQKDGTVKRTIVKTDIQDINNIEITSGLKENDEVITGPYDVVNKKLRTGEKVKVVDKKDLY